MMDIQMVVIAISKKVGASSARGSLVLKKTTKTFTMTRKINTSILPKYSLIHFYKRSNYCEQNFYLKLVNSEIIETCCAAFMSILV